MKKCKIPDKIRIPLMILIVASLAVTSVALVAPKWDHLFEDKSVGSYALVIDVYQNLWSITDKSSSIYKDQGKIIPVAPDQKWKEPIRFLIFAALGSGFLSLVLVIVGSVLTKLENLTVQISLLSLVIMLCGAAGGICIKSAMDFKEKHKRILSEEAFLPINSVPVETFNVDMGYTLALTSGGLFAASALFALTAIVVDVIKRKLTKVKDVSIKPSS